MTSIRTALTVMACTTFFGCASVKYNYQAEAMDISEPPLDSINIAYVGDELLRQGNFRMHEAVIFRDDVKVGTLGSYTMMRGEYLKIGEDNTAEYYNPGSTSNPGFVKVCALCDPFQSVMVYKDEPKVCGVSVFGGKTCRSGVDLERTQLPIYNVDSFQRTLLYSGKIGDKLNISYREFSNNAARPAFNNDVEYDLSQSMVIGYKGAQLEIIEVTNEYIKYRVVRNFNLAKY